MGGDRQALLPQKQACVQGERGMNESRGERHRARSCLMRSVVSGKWEASLKERGLVGGLGKDLGKPRSERPEINPRCSKAPPAAMRPTWLAGKRP